MNRKHKFFESGQLTPNLAKEDLEARITNAIRHMTRKTTTKVKDQSVAANVSRELSRKIASRTLDYLAAEGIKIRGSRMMDLGAGLGMLSEEAAFRGATPVAIEPGNGFREITLERIRRSGSGVAIAAMAENLPFRHSCFDVVVGLQVLEHVQYPASVIGEVYRILKPGGWFYLTCPNYLSFYEGHYDVVWLPLLPKFLGSLYLRLRGRPTEFLNTSITYTTLPGVRRMLRRCGFLSVRESDIYDRCRSPDLIKNSRKRFIIRAARRLLSANALAKAMLLHEQLVHLWIRDFAELVQKPDAYSHHAARFRRPENRSAVDIPLRSVVL
jgi:2-polyprenyl-3-methyl-5-hydroxy-6-metoxy-1,4-benzoquinol methylase